MFVGIMIDVLVVRGEPVPHSGDSGGQLAFEAGTVTRKRAPPPEMFCAADRAMHHL